MVKKVFLVPIALVALSALIVNVPMALAGDESCRNRANNTFDKLLECVTIDGVRQHQAAFQAAADANGGTRAAGTPGYDASVEYVVDTLEAAGYEIVINPFVVTVDPLVISYNVLAELPGGDDGNVVMVGAQLDSVSAGPGIQDNGSGSAAILETAVQLSNVKPRNKVRFAWWGATEFGLVGSTAYVNGLTQEEQDNIALYLNFDMIGSPNHVFFIYDGDDSDGVGAGPGPEGSAQIEYLFEYYYLQVGQPFKGTDFDGGSDYGPFIAVGIPSGGLFTGAEGVKTEEEVALWGGTAGDQYDPCYHLACDTFDNINLNALEINADAVAFSVLQYAMNTEAVNGVKGKGNFLLPPL